MSEIKPHEHRTDGITTSPLGTDTGCLDCPLPGSHQIHDPARVAGYQASIAALAAAVDARYDTDREDA